MPDPDPYQLVVASSASRAISLELPESVAAAVIDLITGALLDLPHCLGKQLGRELDRIWSARRGTYRILYAIDDERRTVTVLRIEHRRDVYRPPT